MGKNVLEFRNDGGFGNLVFLENGNADDADCAEKGGLIFCFT
jgi:hypothetical protein